MNVSRLITAKFPTFISIYAVENFFVGALGTEGFLSFRLS